MQTGNHFCHVSVCVTLACAVVGDTWQFPVPLECVLHHADDSDLTDLRVVDRQVQPLSDICKSTDPLKYLYQSQTAQEYENLIAGGVTAGELEQLGPFYLRESDKQLEGVIRYQKQGEIENEVTFMMDQERFDAGEYEFSRNHTWIVYAYYSKSGLVAVSVVLKGWTDTPKEHEVHNW